MDTMPHDNVMALTHGRGLFATQGGGLFATEGGGLYATASHGGKLSKIGQAFNKAFNPQKNGVAKAVQHTIVAPIENKVVNPIVKVGDQIKTGVVKTYNQAKTGTSNLDYDLKTGARYLIPAITGSLGGAAGAAIGGLSTFGAAAPIGGIMGSAAGAYAGYKADQALGLGNNNDFKPIGKGLKKHRKSKGGALKKGAIKDALDKTWKEVPKEFHQPLEDLGRAGVEYAGYKIPPKGKGVKGSKSKTHKNEQNYTTKKGDKYFHRGGHEETESESDTDSENGSITGNGIKKRKPHMVKGSAEAKAHMAKIRAMKGKGIVGNGQKDNNSPHSGAVRMSAYQNF